MRRSDGRGVGRVGVAGRGSPPRLPPSPPPRAPALAPAPHPVSRDAGYITAESALVIPTLMLFAAMLLWGVMAGCAQIQCVDAARAGARAAARSEPPGAVLAAAKEAGPGGARVAVSKEGDLVRVRVEASAPGIGSLTLRLGGEAVALAEEAVGR